MLKAHQTPLLVVILFSLSLNTAAGLECPSRAGIADEFSRATAVFMGKAVAKEYRRVDYSASGSVGEAQVLVIKFKVERSWKGVRSEEVVLYTSVTKASNGLISSHGEDFSFHQGESYLVYSYGPPDKLRTNACARTSKLSQAGEDLRELGEDSPPMKNQK